VTGDGDKMTGLRRAFRPGKQDLEKRGTSGGSSLQQSGLSGGHGQDAGSAFAFAGNQINRLHLRVRLRVVNRRTVKRKGSFFPGVNVPPCQPTLERAPVGPLAVRLRLTFQSRTSRHKST